MLFFPPRSCRCWMRPLAAWGCPGGAGLWGLRGWLGMGTPRPVEERVTHLLAGVTHLSARVRVPGQGCVKIPRERLRLAGHQLCGASSTSGSLGRPGLVLRPL